MSGFVFDACHELTQGLPGLHVKLILLDANQTFPPDAYYCILLTHTGRELPGPVVILLADAHRWTDEPETRITLVNYCVPVAEVFTDHLTVHDPFWNAAVAGWEKSNENVSYVVHKTEHSYQPIRLQGSEVRDNIMIKPIRVILIIKKEQVKTMIYEWNSICINKIYNMHIKVTLTLWRCSVIFFFFFF